MVYGKHISCENPNKYKSMKTYTQQLFQTFLAHLNTEFWSLKLEWFFFVYKNLFSFARLNRFLFLGVFKCQVSAYWFLNHLGLTCRFLLYIVRVIKLLEASDRTKHGRHLGNQEKKKKGKNWYFFCAWHVK